MYNNSYMSNYLNNLNQQNLNDRIDSQISQLQQIREQIKNQPTTPTPTNLTQNFQLAPNSIGGMKYVNSIDDVNKETVFVDTPFFDKDFSVMWLKNAKGEIKTYELNEIVVKDDKDMLIESLQMQINDLRKGLENAKSTNTNDDEPTKNTKPTNVRTNKSSK